MKNKCIAITGANGFVGKHLQKTFKNTVIISRHDTEAEIVAKLKGVDVVINLAGAPIVKRWSEAYKKVLYSSRIESTKKLVSAINSSDVAYFISTSAIGIYPNDTQCDESCDTFANDFLANLCQEWEAEALRCSNPTAILRFGVVLGKEGGALAKMLLPFKLGLGGNIGDGKMMTSWIAIDDLMQMYDFLIAHKSTGIFNAVSPYPIDNATFTKALGKTLNRPTMMPLPPQILKLIYGEASYVLLDSKELYPKYLLDKGFEFKYPTINHALKHLLSKE